MKKVLLLLPDLFDSVGGIQIFDRALVKALSEIASEKNLEVNVLVLVDKGESKVKDLYISSTSTRYFYYNYNRLKFAVDSLVHSFNADLVIFGSVNFAQLSILMNLINKNQKRFLIVHGIDVWEKLPLLKRLGVSFVDRIIAVSEYTKRQMMKHNNILESKFSIFPNTLDPYYARNALECDKDKIGLPTGKIILSVSRLSSSDRRKNIDLIIKVMPQVLEEVPDACCVIVGDGSDRLRLEKLALDLGVKEKVIFTGRISDELLPAYYKACDLFVLPSTQEGFGIVFLEAMYFSKPCIGARVGGIPEVIEDGKTGYLIEPGDINSLADSIIKLLKNKNLSENMGRVGKERLEKEFSFKMFKKRLEMLLRK